MKKLLASLSVAFLVLSSPFVLGVPVPALAEQPKIESKEPVKPTISGEVTASAECVAPNVVLDDTCKLPPPPPQPYQLRSSYNHYPFGECTWGVANLRDIAWYGNAAQWYANSAPFRPRGLQPRQGAIMVTWESALGHVALVNRVFANGSYEIYEMNNSLLGGWGRYNFRTLFAWEVPLIGFIY